MMQSAFIIGISAILITCLNFHVSLVRMKTKIMFGDGENERLARARRAHFTFVEYSLIFLVTLFIYEKIGGAES